MLKNKLFLHIAVIILISSFIAVSANAKQAEEQGLYSSLELKGTVFTRSLKHIAIIKDLNSQRVAMYELGDEVNGAVILHIERGKVVLQKEGKEFTLGFPGGGIIQPVSKGVDLVFNKQAGTYRISKKQVNEVLLNIPRILKQVRITPYFYKGRPSGMRLSSIKEEGIFKEAGVKSEDVIKSVNGLSLNTPGQIFGAYKKLKNKNAFKVEVIRNNEPVVLNYVIE